MQEGLNIRSTFNDVPIEAIRRDDWIAVERGPTICLQNRLGHREGVEGGQLPCAVLMYHWGLPNDDDGGPANRATLINFAEHDALYAVVYKVGIQPCDSLEAIANRVYQSICSQETIQPYAAV